MKKLPSSKAPSCAVDKYIGTDFDHVVHVSSEMESVKEVAEVTEHIVVTGSNIEAIKTVATNIGDVNNVSDNMEYVKDVAAGIEGLPVVSYIGSEPPAQPVEGATWYCTTDGRTYVWYKDTDSYQWVESSPQSIAKDDVRTPIVARAALERALLLDGYTLVTGSFELGATLTKATDVILQEVTGKVYSWGGTFPATVPTGSTPDSTGGIGSNTWTLRSVPEVLKRIEAEEADTQDWKGFTEELLAQAGTTDNGQPDRLGESQRVNAIKILAGKNAHTRPERNAPNAHNAESITAEQGNLQSLLDASTPVTANVIAQRVTQQDFIPKALSMVNITGMYTYSEGGVLYVGYNMGQQDSTNPEYGVEYSFVPDDDGLILYTGSKCGVLDKASPRIVASQFTIDSGSLNTVSPPSAYTTTALGGAVLSGTFTGKSLMFKSYGDTRGGMWRITLDSSTGHYEKKVSTWRPTAFMMVQDVFTDLPLATYTYKLEFIGDDPDHVPSSGAGTSRGWIYHTPNNPAQQPLVLSKLYPLDQSTAKVMSPANTVLAFAYSAKPAGSSATLQWVPEHSGVAGVAMSINYKLMVDGVLTDNAAGTITDSKFKEVNKVSIIQRFSARNPAEPSTQMWLHYITQSMDSTTTELSILNRLEFSIDTDVGAGYVGMTACNPTNFNRVAFNNGSEVSPLLTNGSSSYSAEGYDSVCWGGEYSTGVYMGIVTSVKLSEACNLFSPLQPTDLTYKDWRNASLNKMYWVNLRKRTSSELGSVPAGTVITSMVRHSSVCGVRSPNDGLKPI